MRIARCRVEAAGLVTIFVTGLSSVIGRRLAESRKALIRVSSQSLLLQLYMLVYN